jgi:hypothetical protein
MAKAGFWLRGAKGKLAGASMGKGANGQTIMREIVTPRNPKSNAQMIQRALMATVMRAYSAGSEIFDHAFQGYARGGMNQHRFVKLNARELRAIIANDLNNSVAVASQKGRVVAPGVATPVPFEMVVSEGSYPQNFYTVGISEDTLGVAVTAPAALNGEKVNEYCNRNGLIPGDIYTIVMMQVDASQNRTPVYTIQDAQDDRQKVYNCEFMWVRLKVKADVLTNEDAIAATGALLTSPLFDIETSINFPTTDLSTKVATGAGDWLPRIGGLGVIRSRKDEDLRSTSKMLVNFGADTSFGLASAYILDAWKAATQAVGDSEYILEGANAGRVVETTNPDDGD